MANAAQLVASSKMFGGAVQQFVHASRSTKTPMRFSVFVPKGACAARPAPVLYYLSGLTCTDENFTHKAGAQRAAAAHNVILVAPDTSPRPSLSGEGGGRAPFDGEDDSYDFGSGAGFYVDATKAPWAGEGGYNMYSYVNEELPEVVADTLQGAACSERRSIFGHSMGGHGALVSALKNPGVFKSVSAFAPISNPTRCAWGEKAFTGYLGSVDAGKAYDATELAKHFEAPDPLPVLIDTGTGDNFYSDGQLLPENFEAACAENSAMLKCESRLQEGYDHSYNFIASFVDDHVSFHAEHLSLMKHLS
jgi:S-formylglutathione hydrolase